MAELSPMMRQYVELKERNNDSILMFRLGDFYEMFFEDAKVASEELDLTLTGRDCGLEERAPMCGVPYHSCEGYISRLVEKGYKVAICEQLEDPSKAKGIVKRDITRIITPGTVIEDTMLDESRNNYLASLCFGEQSAALCFVDASTGSCHITEISGCDMQRRVTDEIMRFSPSEILIDRSVYKNRFLSDFLKNTYNGAVTVRPEESFDAEATNDLICSVFEVVSPENLGVEKNSNLQQALGAAVEYLHENSRGNKILLKSVDVYSESKLMRLDMTAIRNLELCETMRSKAKKGSLLWVLDRTKTAMGKRLIRSWILNPLLSMSEIVLRQNGVEELCQNTLKRGELSEYMGSVRDIERIITKAVYGTANPKDLLNLAATTRNFPIIKELLRGSSCKILQGIYSEIDPCRDIADLIESAIDENSGLLMKDGGIIKDGFNSDVDRLREDMNGGTSYLTEIENRERERTGIKNLRVRYNKVFGYYIEVTNSFKNLVPEDYIRKQTLTNAERYITEELKILETRVLGAKDKLSALEYELFDNIRKQVASAAEKFRITADAIARLDVLCSFAAAAVDNNYTRPIIDNSGTVSIDAGRHPVVEQLIKTPFVTNDTYLDNKENRCAIITGPNMAGKSTYMRQTALIVLMAQIGSFVPAQNARIGIVDAIFTRVGASDDLASGQSTFMVEMSEVADILKNATKNSLLILDEIGRGTSTYDGMSIARAVLEYVADKKKLGAKALFATHYHELTSMENELSGVKNYNIAAKKRGDDIIFLRRIIPGSADQSYGIEVANLSGIPKTVIERAKEILKQTEEQGIVTYKKVASDDSMIPLELQGAQDILEELKVLDVNTLTPIEAMGMLFDLVNKAKSI
ncbi:MAG: DNA mismatch repair protein MutS [Clostridia bacterium]|nr:DNA mismatch repair protein MutS [Clostridia bacterium]